jgi:RNA polymerase sigma-70 factor (ECF subfamily)
MKDDVAILLAREGNEDAFRRLYNDNRERIYRIAYRYTRSVDDADDVMQETFIKAFKRIDSFSFRGESSFSTWLGSICINCSIDHLRKHKRRKMDATISLEDMTIDPVTNDESPEQAAEMEETIRLIHNAADQLTPKQRVIFDLRYSQHHSIREISELLNCSENSIKTHLSRSVQKLKTQLAPIWRER